jgi:hypothetical protein
MQVILNLFYLAFCPHYQQYQYDDLKLLLSTVGKKYFLFV